MLNPSYDGYVAINPSGVVLIRTFHSVPSPSISSFVPSVPNSPNPSTVTPGSTVFSAQDTGISRNRTSIATPIIVDSHALPDGPGSSDGYSNSRYITYPHPFHLLAHESNRRRLIESLSSWNFEPHKLSSDEVISCALLLFEAFLRGVPGGVISCITLGEYQRIRHCSYQLTCFVDHLPPFLYHLQTIYRQTNSYHNFEHALDTFQALYHFLSQVGMVPDVKSLLDEDLRDPVEPRPRIPSILDALTNEDILVLCIAAVGHDAGHPGLTNAFMVRLTFSRNALQDSSVINPEKRTNTIGSAL